MTSYKQSLIVTALLAGSLAAGYFAYTINAPSSDPVDTRVDSETLASMALKTPEGQVISLNQWAGKPQLVNFWATWCGPCRDEMPVLVNAQQDYADQGLVVIGLSMDYPDDTRLVQQFAEEFNVNFPILMAADEGNDIAKSYGAENFVLPISVFITADGTVTKVHTGLLTAEQAKTELQKLF